ncbi:MAG: CatB-related O-acetyltransferase [Planctomycetes bacterium]|nr:CatB-related O-acetyltransferase [Planctomycetota bacterium]
MRSATARDFMSKYHGVDVGAYSYGDCFDPAIIPPGISIGRYVSIARGVRMFTQNHPLDRVSTHPFFYEACPGVSATADLPPGHLEIGHDVWLGCNAIITPGCHRIGNGAVIGAGAVVTRDVPAYAIVAGSPAKTIRDRFTPAQAERLEASEWWNLSEAEVRARMPEFTALLSSHE